MPERESLLQGIDVPGAKGAKGKDLHARGELLELGGAGAKATKSSKAVKAKAEADADADGVPSAGASADRLKLGIVTLCLVVAGVLLAQYFGLIELWGGVPPLAPPTEVEQAHVQEGIKFQKQEQARIEALPPEKRPVPAGS